MTHPSTANLSAASSVPSSPALFERVSSVFRAQGWRGTLLGVVRRLLRPTARSFGIVRQRVDGGRGFEIGGPSRIFAAGGLLPVYELAERVDNCNFAATTLWAQHGEGGQTFRFSERRAPGRQLVAEATRLDGIADASYDFVLSSHSLEHTANPLKALREWSRILKRGGTLVLIVPHRDGTFDHRRPVTTLEHLIEDHRVDRAEDDLTHLDEVLALHDLRRDPGADPATFPDRLRRNAAFRSMHHHVFDARLALAVVEWAGFQALAVEPLLPDHIIVIGEKGAADARPWTGPIRSPFRSDRTVRP